MDIDKKTIWVLSNKKRIKILKELKERRMTVSEIARDMKISKSTALYHTSQLYTTGLIEKEECNKWIYYALSENGKNLLNMKNKFRIVLSITFFSTGSAIYSLYKIIEKTRAEYWERPEITVELFVLFAALTVIVLSIEKLRRVPHSLYL